jgi:hypothetical protein
MRKGGITFIAAILAIASAGVAADPVEFGVGSFAFSRPAGWGWIVPASPMRKAQLSVPGSSGGDAGEVTFFHFGAGQGGGVQANVDRWFGQFRNGSTRQNVETIGTTRVTFVEAEGTFLSGMPGTSPTPRDGFAMRGAILEDAVGGDVFVKMTGPLVVVKAAEAEFRAMISGAASRTASAR